jgi:hypothetical protein
MLTRIATVGCGFSFEVLIGPISGPYAIVP